jgi:hypothetical protein
MTEQTYQTFQRSDIMRKVDALIAKAHSTESEHERDALLAKAEAMMVRHAIAQHELDAARKPEDRKTPEVATFTVASAGNAFTRNLVDLHWALVRHVGAAGHYFNANGKYKEDEAKAIIVGFPDQLAYLDTLYTSLHLHISTKLEPKADPCLTLAENIAAIRGAGVRWPRLLELLQAIGLEEGVEYSGNVGRRHQGIYRQFCRDNGLEQNRTMPVTYQSSFVAGFVSEVRGRLVRMREATSEERSGSKALALVDREEVARTLHSELFATSPVGAAAKRKLNDSALARGRAEGRTADLSGGASRVERSSKRALESN